MAKDSQNIGDLIRKIGENNEEVYSLLCKVVKVSEDVAELAPLNGDANLLGVKLIAGTSTTSILITPVIDSVVVATFLSKNTAYISLHSEIESVAIRGDQFGGLIKVEELVKKINRLESKVNSLITKFNSHTHLYAPGPSAPVPTAPIITGEAAITPTTQKSDLENQKVKHG